MSGEKCHWSPWGISPVLPADKHETAAELEKTQKPQKGTTAVSGGKRENVSKISKQTKNIFFCYVAGIPSKWLNRIELT